jgi:hypothetical protein
MLLASSFRVGRGDVWAFFQIAPETRQAQVVVVISSLVLLRDDVINLMEENRCALRQVAVFTGVLRSTPNPGALWRGRDHDAIRGAQYSSAWSFSKLSRSLRCTICSYSARSS